MRGLTLVAALIALAAVAVSLSSQLVMPSPPPAEAGGLPEKIPPDWVIARAVPDADIMRTIAKIPHDPNPLGVRQALLLKKEYPLLSTFLRVTFSSADGTPLVGRLGQWHGEDARPRPGVVVVNGFSQTKDDKPLVEIAELLFRNGWHVLTFDPRGHGDSRRLSPAITTMGWKETDDLLAAVRTLREKSGATSVAVIGVSTHGRSLVKAMAQDQGQLIAAGIAVSAPLGSYARLQPPPPGWTPTPIQKYFLDFLGASSFYEHYERAASSYGIDLETLEGRMSADGAVARVARPLLLLTALDDVVMLAQIKDGQHDAGMYSLAYRDTVRDHPHVRTLLADRGNHGGLLYLSDPHWFSLLALTYLKHWQARDAEHVTVAAAPLDLLAEGVLERQIARYRLLVRNHGQRAVGPVDVHLQLPPDARLKTCWAGFEGLGACAKEDSRVRWTLPRLSGGKSTAGPLVAEIDVGRLKPGAFEVRSWITTVEGPRESLEEGNAAAIPQRVMLTKP